MMEQLTKNKVIEEEAEPTEKACDPMERYYEVSTKEQLAKDRLTIYNAARTVPEEAKKEITSGKLRGLTEINPMWRIKKLTELFGAAGFGWYYEIENLWLENGADGAVIANAKIRLYVLGEYDWSHPIVGIGGSKFISRESGGIYTNDEAYKMALTDALSVACKSLGIGADVYMGESDKTGESVEFQKVDGEIPMEDHLPKCLECGGALSDEEAVACKKKYGILVCSEKCKKWHDVREKMEGEEE